MPRELSTYERRSHRVTSGAWFYHTLGSHLDLIIDLDAYGLAYPGGNPPLCIKIPLKGILWAERVWLKQKKKESNKGKG